MIIIHMISNFNLWNHLFFQDSYDIYIYIYNFYFFSKGQNGKVNSLKGKIANFTNNSALGLDPLDL